MTIDLDNMTVLGYRRENGRVGVRNHVAILPVDDISNAACEAVANNIKGTMALPHAYGRLQFGADLDLHFRTMIGTGSNPNVAAVVVIGIVTLKKFRNKGADVEICYRMLFLTDYKIAFNERAVVWEPGEESLRALLKQRFRIGIGNILLQKKFAPLFRRKADGNRLRRTYWRLRSGFGELGRLALGYPRALLFRSDRIQAYDLTVGRLMWIAQRLGRWYGRLYVHQLGLRPEPVDPLRIEPYVDGRLKIGARIAG
jgi:hypothetical protein